jgi:bacterioferritin
MITNRIKIPTENAEQTELTRETLIDLLNEDLAREYQAIIAYVIYSKIIKGAEYMDIANELETHASEELQHALMVAKQIDYLGGCPTTTPKEVKLSDNVEDLLRFDLENEKRTIEEYRERIKQAEALGEFALAQALRSIILQEQEHLIDLSDALGMQPPAP